MKKLLLLFVVYSLSAIREPSVCPYGDTYYVYNGKKYRSYNDVIKAGYKERAIISQTVGITYDDDYRCTISNGLTSCTCNVKVDEGAQAVGYKHHGGAPAQAQALLAITENPAAGQEQHGAEQTGIIVNHIAPVSYSYGPTENKIWDIQPTRSDIQSTVADDHDPRLVAKKCPKGTTPCTISSMQDDIMPITKCLSSTACQEAQFAADPA